MYQTVEMSCVFLKKPKESLKEEKLLSQAFSFFLTCFFFSIIFYLVSQEHNVLFAFSELFFSIKWCVAIIFAIELHDKLIFLKICFIRSSRFFFLQSYMHMTCLSALLWYHCFELLIRAFNPEMRYVTYGAVKSRLKTVDRCDFMEKTRLQTSFGT